MSKTALTMSTTLIKLLLELVMVLPTCGIPWQTQLLLSKYLQGHMQDNSLTLFILKFIYLKRKYMLKVNNSSIYIYTHTYCIYTVYTVYSIYTICVCILYINVCVYCIYVYIYCIYVYVIYCIFYIYYIYIINIYIIYSYYICTYYMYISSVQFSRSVMSDSL